MLTPSPTPDTTRKDLWKYYRRDELEVVEELLPLASISPAERQRICDHARMLIIGIRQDQVGRGGVDALLKEFALSTEEGIVLMCLAEALLRIPDKLTTDRLIRDKLMSGDWAAHLGNSESLFVNASAWGLLLTGQVISLGEIASRPLPEERFVTLKKAVSRLGEPVIRASIRYAMQIMGTQFVMGKNIHSALERAQPQETRGYRYSYDMLGEGARTMPSADRYYQSYLDAIEAIGRAASQGGPVESPGISIKLSALHPRYDFTQHRRVSRELIPRLKQLAIKARYFDIGLTIDAEEADRLDLSLKVIEEVFSDPDLDDWHGFGLAIQAYQKRAPQLVEWTRGLAQRVGRKMMVRLVKGAYWDSEIKWTQQEGFDDYPVFTRKSATDLCYQVCAKKLMAYRDLIYPQFATHNAYTVSTILEMDKIDTENYRQGYEFQRLHGMGEALYDQIMESEGLTCRIYAPVGEHADLLAYLVRRLLENGANSSFVNNIVDDRVPVEFLLRDPVSTLASSAVKRSLVIPLPQDLFLDADRSRISSSISSSIKSNDKADTESHRCNSSGLDLANAQTQQELELSLASVWRAQQVHKVSSSGSVPVRNPANRVEILGYLKYTEPEQMEEKLAIANAAHAEWSAMPQTERSALLRKLADVLESNRDSLIGLCIKEAGKTVADSVSETREAVDFCRYYANQAANQAVDLNNSYQLGVVLCISPWNFPLAIFVGQVVAALVVGNTVIAKPAEQTSLIALKVAELMTSCGFPPGILELVISPGKPVGQQLIPDHRIQGVLFTGSTDTGRWLAQALAQRAEIDIPLIAETGGQNAMIIDSTALPEQVVDDVITSGFMSAGQRCSALRVLFLQNEVAETIIDMIQGAMKELIIGDPALLSTDVGPVIDENAYARLVSHRDYLARAGQRASLLYQCELSDGCENGIFFPPHLYEISHISVLTREVFGPVVHVIRYRAEELDQVIQQINATGYGLTLGIHSRNQTTAMRITRQAQVGNVYINRNMVGAVVGVQPFGGRGFSGTGPKAGGPNYLPRLLRQRQMRKPVLQKTFDDIEFHPIENEVLAAINEAQLAWATSDFKLKQSIIKKVLSLSFMKKTRPQNGEAGQRLEPRRLVDDLLELASSRLNQALDMPGPTGEHNQLLFESRGLIAVLLAEGTSPTEALRYIVAGLLSGNAILMLVEKASDTEELTQWFHVAEDLPKHLVTLLPWTAAKTTLSLPDLDAVCLPNPARFALSAQKLLATRPGPLIPLIMECDNQRLLIRLSIEKTVSIDTTAAGGNASLLASASD